MARTLLASGASTVAELAERLDLTGAAVRKHLDELVEAGLVDCTERPPYGPEKRRGRGRPARFFHLSPEGRRRFETGYQDLAVGALRFLADHDGDDAVMEFARQRVSTMEREFDDVLALCDIPGQRVEELAQALTTAGYAAVVVPAGSGVQLCQHNCPIAHVAEEFPQFCEAETEAFGRLLGTHVMRLATLAHGDGVCTTHVPSVRSDAHPAAFPAANPEGRSIA